MGYQLEGNPHGQSLVHGASRGVAEWQTQSKDWGIKLAVLEAKRSELIKTLSIDTGPL